ncbi:hypothetical protein PRIPAC_74145, partial [Pristionchus pacificus]
SRLSWRMRSAVFLALVAAVSGSHVLNEIRDRVISAEAEALTGQALVDYLNANQQMFTAKLNTRFAKMSEKAKMVAINGIAPSIDELAAQLDQQGRVTHDDLADTTIPESFDARQAWPQCPEIPMIRDQSSCGSCWAMATGEIISDRICIASGGSQQFNISSDDLMSCCGLQCGNGCNGGNPLSAMKWYVSHGVVTGSNYEDHAGCMPYPFPPCEHHNTQTKFDNCDNEPDFKTPTCTKSCVEGYPLTYAQDKHYGKSAYGLSRKVVDIQKEIMTNGPIVAGFNVYEDFEQYSGGIYAHHAGKYLGGHAVKVIGWGQENGTPYWLVNNSWNTDWGENGLFRIIRGTNDCGFEASMVAGLPKL